MQEMQPIQPNAQTLPSGLVPAVQQLAATERCNQSNPTPKRFRPGLPRRCNNWQLPNAATNPTQRPNASVRARPGGATTGSYRTRQPIQPSAQTLPSGLAPAVQQLAATERLQSIAIRYPFILGSPSRACPGGINDSRSRVSMEPIRRFHHTLDIVVHAWGETRLRC
ncbi:hypothetical protein Pla52n_52540 [Stieleria varia]|uniref:Uncharacterized protein n=1 Tax=Stieleria varia TaxID=2528005 RepID=A0A5C6A806_9BACT|nr:hypothetical protein Pla52n_52540 [Stieleria varia]